MSKFQRGHTRAAKLTAEHVYRIRQMYDEGWSQGRLAREFNMSVGHIGRIVRGESWNSQAKPLPKMASDEEIAASAERVAKLMQQASKERQQNNLVDDLLKDDKGDSKDG